MCKFIQSSTTEGRAQNGANGASGESGPDATFVHPNGDITHVDASGINPYSHTYQQRAAREFATEAQTNFQWRFVFLLQAFSPHSKSQAVHVTTLGYPPLIIVIGPRTPATTP